MFDPLDRQLKGFAGLGSGLKNSNGIRNMLGLSTTSYRRYGEVAGYAEKIAKVSKAARYMKAGGHVGIALNVAASGLAIHQACSVGREEECTEAKYIEGGKLAGGLALSRAMYVGSLDLFMVSASHLGYVWCFRTACLDELYTMPLGCVIF